MTWITYDQTDKNKPLSCSNSPITTRLQAPAGPKLAPAAAKKANSSADGNN